MERRDRSRDALRELIYVDSLDTLEKAPALQRWVEKYFDGDFENNFYLELQDLEKLAELFYKNIKFLKEHRMGLKVELDEGKDIKKFFS